MIPPVELEIIGIPAPQGSKTSYYNPKLKRAVTVEGTSKSGRIAHAEWRRAVADGCRDYLADHPQQPMTGPLEVQVSFRFPIVASDKYRYWHAVQPDIDKLERSTLDALKIGGLIRDDAAVAKVTKSKRYLIGDESPGCTLKVTSLADEEQQIRESRKERAAQARRRPSMAMEALPL
jgi:Holliday junction resolvase RusA-like endonuclease